MLVPSQHDQEFSTADLARARITQDQIGQIIQQFTPGMTGSPENLDALLATIAKMQVPVRCRYIIYPYELASTMGQQYLTENLHRVALLIIPKANNVEVLFDEGPVNKSVTGGTNNPRAFVLEANTTLRDYALNLQMVPAPVNPVTLLNPYGVTATGLILEGVSA